MLVPLEYQRFHVEGVIAHSSAFFSKLILPARPRLYESPFDFARRVRVTLCNSGSGGRANVVGFNVLTGCRHGPR